MLDRHVPAAFSNYLHTFAGEQAHSGPMTSPRVAGDISPPEQRKRGRPMTCVELVEALCEASAPLREAQRLHRESYETLIPHVFMGDVLRRMGQCFVSGSPAETEGHGVELRGILGVLERGMTEGDREARNVISVSFVRDGEVELFFSNLYPMLGPKMRAQVGGA
jgi:hypothetical protein